MMNLKLGGRLLRDFGTVLLDDVDELQFEREGNSSFAETELKSSLEGVRRGEVEDGDVRRLISF